MCSFTKSFDPLGLLSRRIPNGLTLIKSGDLYALQLDLLKDINKRVWHGSFLRINGVSKPPFYSLNTGYSSGDEKCNIEKNQELILNSLGFSRENVAIPELCHTTNVGYLTSNNQKKKIFFANTDAVISSSFRHCLFISTADCNPIFLIDRYKDLIAIVHSGWKGLVGNIIEKTIQKMVSNGSLLQDIFAGVGPSIGPCCYKLREPAQNKMPEWKNYLSSSEDGLTAIDLWKPAEDQLINAGVPRANIQIARFCTSCNEDLFFSYWKGKPLTGRFASVIFMR